MNEKDVVNNLGYCGKVCLFCEKAVFCEGCRARKPLQARWNSRDGCYHYGCCRKKGINGCWECEDAPCEHDEYATSHDPMMRAFAVYAKEHGVDALGKAVFINQIRGILYGEGKAYDHLEHEEDVIEVLQTGKRHKTKG